MRLQQASYHVQVCVRPNDRGVCLAQLSESVFWSWRVPVTSAGSSVPWALAGELRRTPVGHVQRSLR
jgi:hypothetical protein